MKLKKEIILIIGILVFIIILEIVTNIVTEKSVEFIEKEIIEINTDMSNIKNINSESSENEKLKKDLEKKIKNLKKDWFLMQDKLCIFSEHNELEKVSKCLICLEENFRNEEYNIALENGSEFLYWLNHIKEKDKLELKNIF